MRDRATRPGASAGPAVARIQWLGHSTVVIDVDGVRLLTDPLLRAHAGLLRRMASRPEPAAWHGVDAVLVSHLHHDHAELGSLRMLPTVPILTSASNASWLRRRGLASAVGLGDGWYGVGRGDVSVRLVRAVHRHRPMPHRPNTANGHLVRATAGTVWVAGDTSLYDAMAHLPELAGGRIDVAVVPVWGWGPRLSKGHLDPQQAARACGLVQARWAVPVHWGTLHPPLMARVARDWLDLPGRRFAAALSAEAPGCTSVVLSPGDSATLTVGCRYGGR